MNFYLILIGFLCVGGCNARVVPLSFRAGRCKRSVSSMNEIKNESPEVKVGASGRSQPDVVETKDMELLNSEADNTTIPDITNVNSSNVSAELTPKEKAMTQESKDEAAESSILIDLLEEKLNSTSELTSQNALDSRNTLEAMQVPGMSKTTDGSINSSPHGSEQRNNLDLVKIEEKDTLDHDTFEFVISDQNETFAIFDVINSEQNENPSSLEVNGNQKETLAPFEVDSVKNETLAPFEVDSVKNETLAPFEVDSVKNETLAPFEVDSDQNETLVPFQVSSNQNSSFISLEVVTSTNRPDDLVESQHLSNDAEVESFLSDAGNITEKLALNSSEFSEVKLSNGTENTAGVILSGFEFLINSEVARNAAKAMEVFNFSDPLTDHIIEENEFHSFLPALTDVNDLGSPSQTDLDTTILPINSGESNESQAGLNGSLPFGEDTPIVFEGIKPGESKKDSLLQINLSEPLEQENKTKLFNLVEKNITSEVSLNNSTEKIELESETTVSNSSAVSVPECPPPGMCLFWFLSQDTCAANEHCLGSRICCKIGCFKTCIEIESLS